MPLHPPKIGAVITTYNRRDLLGPTLQSVLYQDGADSSVIVVVDDGSTDGTVEYLLDEFPADIAHVDDRIAETSLEGSPHGMVRVIRQQNQHIAVAHNTGIRELLRLECPYLTHLDAEDLAFPNKHCVLAAYLDAHPGVGLVHAQSQDMSFDGFLFSEGSGPFEQVYRRARPEGAFWERAARGGFHAGDLAQGNYVHNQTTMYTRRAVTAAGEGNWFSEGMRYGSDWTFYQRLERAGVPFGFVPAYVAFTRAHTGGISGTRSKGLTLDQALVQAASSEERMEKADAYQWARAKWPAEFEEALQRTGTDTDFAALAGALQASLRQLVDAGDLVDALNVAHRMQRLAPTPSGRRLIRDLVDAIVAQLAHGEPSLPLAKQLFALQPSPRHAAALARLLADDAAAVR